MRCKGLIKESVKIYGNSEFCSWLKIKILAYVQLGHEDDYVFICYNRDEAKI